MLPAVWHQQRASICNDWVIMREEPCLTGWQLTFSAGRKTVTFFPILPAHSTTWRLLFAQEQWEADGPQKQAPLFHLLSTEWAFGLSTLDLG